MITGIIIPILWHFSPQYLLSTTAASFVGFFIMRLANPTTTRQSHVEVLVCAGVGLVSIPVMGFLLDRERRSDRTRYYNFTESPDPHEVVQHIVTGIIAAAFGGVIYGVVVWAGVLLSPLFTSLLTALTQRLLFVSSFPDALKVVIFNLGQFNTWVYILILFASISTAGQLLKGGLLRFIYRILRFLVMAVICILIALWIEKGFENVLTSWIMFKSLWRYLLLNPWVLFAWAAGLGFLFVLVYQREEIPWVFISLIFTVWFLQLIIVSAALAFVCGMVALLLRNLYIAIFPVISLDPSSIFTFEELFPLVGVWLGIAVGTGWFISQWMRGDLGPVVRIIKKATDSFSNFINSLIQQILKGNASWFLQVGFMALGIFLDWMSWAQIFHAFD